MSSSKYEQDSASRLPEEKIQAILNEHPQLRGNITDTAGQPWEGRSLQESTLTHSADDKEHVAQKFYQTMFDFSQGLSDEADVIKDFADMHVYVPIIANLVQADLNENDNVVSDKESDMSVAYVIASDGRRALPVFTDTSIITHWNSAARPVKVEAARAALAAVSDKVDLLVINPGWKTYGSVFNEKGGENINEFIIRRPAVWALAQGNEWTPSYSDKAVENYIHTLVSSYPQIKDVKLNPHEGIISYSADQQLRAGGGIGPELKIELVLAPDLSAEQRQTLMQDLSNKLYAQADIAEAIDSVQFRLV